MQSSESVKMEATTTMTAAAAPIQGREGSQGDGEKGIACSSQTMELKVGADDVTEAHSLDPNPLALAGHKRKASSEIDPHRVNSSDPLSSPTAEQHAEMVPPQGGEKEKVEDDKNVPQRGILVDLNQGLEEMDAYLYDDVFKEKVEKVETVAEDNIAVKPEGEKGELSDFDLNQEGGVIHSNKDREKEKVETSDTKMENPDVKPDEGLSKMDTDLGEETVNVGKETAVETDSIESKEVVPYVAENVEIGSSAIEGESCVVVENTEAASENKQEEPASLIDEIYQMELTCELNKECDPFSDDDVESTTSAVPAETHAADKNEVEVADKMEVESYDVVPEKKNEEMETHAAEKVDVLPHDAVDQEKMKNEVELDDVEKVGGQLCTEKQEEGHSTTGENEVETSSPVKVGLLRDPLDFDLDLNELPSMEDD
ncbi:uncharacterized protein LOC108335434 [Vigna angularis]|nr:uncharacterized protein LOC108335434 [Vigna angularis]